MQQQTSVDPDRPAEEESDPDVAWRLVVAAARSGCGDFHVKAVVGRISNSKYILRLMSIASMSAAILTSVVSGQWTVKK